MAAQRVVLIIEDDRNFSRILEAKLHKSSYSVFAATDAVEGLSSLIAQRVDVVLLDGRLPDVDGLFALPLLLAAAPLTPFVFMTAYEELYPRARVLAAGGSELLYKPFDLGLLMETVSRLIEQAATPLSIDAPTEFIPAMEDTSAEALAVVSGEVLSPRIERRQHPRVPLQSPVAITPSGGAQPDDLDSTIHGMILDISLGGLALVAIESLQEGAEVRLRFSLAADSDDALDSEACVVRVETVEGPPPLTLHRMAVRFAPTSPESAGLLQGLIAPHSA